MTNESDTWYWEKTWSDFRCGSSRLRIRWSNGDAAALLYDEGVPETVTAILSRLPLTVPVVHVAWSGDAIMSTRAYDVGPERAENAVRLPYPGDLTWDPKFGELAFIYGTAEARLPSGENTLVVYGTIQEGLADFATFCRARRFEGIGELTLSLE